MKYLLLIMVLIGCGVDPDDFQAEDSDGCKSDDLACQEALAGTTTDVEEETKAETEEETAEVKGVEERNTQAITVESEVTVKTKVVIGPNGEEISEDSALACQAGRICRGMAKSEVLDLLGEPVTLEKKDPFEVWKWEEWSLENILCGSFTCTVSFRDGLVVDQGDVNTQWLDLENF